MKMQRDKYIPGVCNIGPAEIAQRRKIGWQGLVVSVILFLVLLLLNVSPAVRFIVFIPAAISATGFLQAYMHFCAGFGSKGLYNFGSEVGKTDSVDQAEYRKQDQQKATKIFVDSLLIGLVVGLICVFI